ncbi:MAG: type I 3-dehydroquinate dehydratase [Euryarchaeota archaeon]|nr:type I 3-dehydroquinate dehydratase [Euryarchaeota archaeon]
MKILPRKPSICASVIAHTVEEFLDAARNARDADVIEIRADGLKVEPPSGQKYRAEIKRLLRNVKIQTGLPVILTIRKEKEGGVFKGSEAERVACIEDAMKLADAIDIELRMEEEKREEIMSEAKKNRIPVILSYHDLDKTPEEDAMKAILEEEAGAGAGMAKLAVKANSMVDVLRLLEVTREMSSKLSIPICTISMGELGKISRIAAPLFGSAISYGYVTRETAPGQLSVSQLKQAFEMLGVR